MENDNSKKIDEEKLRLLIQQASLLRDEFQNVSNQLNNIRNIAEQFGFYKTSSSLLNIQTSFMQAYKMVKKEVQELVDKME